MGGKDKVTKRDSHRPISIVITFEYMKLILTLFTQTQQKYQRR